MLREERREKHFQSHNYFVTRSLYKIISDNLIGILNKKKASVRIVYNEDRTAYL